LASTELSGRRLLQDLDEQIEPIFHSIATKLKLLKVKLELLKAFKTPERELSVVLFKLSDFTKKNNKTMLTHTKLLFLFNTIYNIM
jgi:hypothetical protein